MSDHEDTDPGDEESWDSNEEDEDDGGFADYYSFNDDEEGRASQFNNNDDPEYFAYECLTVANVEKIFNESIETVKTGLGVSHAQAKQASSYKNQYDLRHRHTLKLCNNSAENFYLTDLGHCTFLIVALDF